jgi:hypothetical protein
MHCNCHCELQVKRRRCDHEPLNPEDNTHIEDANDGICQKSREHTARLRTVQRGV